MQHNPHRTDQTYADELEERLINFAVRIVKLASQLPRTPGKHVAAQALRAGTSPAPNYGEARGAESHADFVHKVRIVLKELNEPRFGTNNRAQPTFGTAPVDQYCRGKS